MSIQSGYRFASIFLLCLIPTLYTPSAHAVFSFGFSGGPTFHTKNYSGASFSGYKSYAQPGFLLQAYLDTNFNKGPIHYEVGYGIQSRNEKAVSPTTVTESSYSMMFLDTLVRLQLPYVSVGGGFYTGFVLGTVTQTVGSAPSRTLSAKDANYRYWDFGLLGSVRVQVPLATHFALTGEGRYFYGTQDTSSLATGDASSREYQILAGIQFNFGSK